MRCSITTTFYINVCNHFCRPEQRIAVVSHAGFIRHTLSAFAGGLSGAAAAAMEREFLNCELRTVVRGCYALTLHSIPHPRLLYDKEQVASHLLEREAPAAACC